MPARTILHAAVLAAANLIGIWLGFLVYAVSETANQLLVQVPVAVQATVAVFAAWVRLLSARGSVRLPIRGTGDGAWIYGLAPLWAAVVFVPLHQVTQGYWTAFSNVLVLWSFQLIANGIAVAVALAIAAAMAARRTVAA
jgi:hypothetical protein